MRLGVPGPRDLLRLAEGGYEAIEQAIALVPRIITLLGQIEAVVAKVNGVMTEVDKTQRQASRIIERTDRLMARTELVMDRTEALIERTGAVMDSTEPLIHRTGAVLDSTEPLIHRTGAVLDSTEPLIHRTGVVLDGTEPLIQRTGVVLDGTDPMMERTGELMSRADELLKLYEPSLRQLEPVLDKLAESTSPAEVTAAIRLIDTLPELVEAMEIDVLPIMKTLGTVAPDLRDLLDTSKELNEILGSLPGLGRIKRRVEERQEIEDHQRLAKDDPPRSPDEVR